MISFDEVAVLWTCNRLHGGRLVLISGRVGIEQQRTNRLLFIFLDQLAVWLLSPIRHTASLWAGWNKEAGCTFLYIRPREDSRGCRDQRSCSSILSQSGSGRAIYQRSLQEIESACCLKLCPQAVPAEPHVDAKGGSGVVAITYCAMSIPGLFR